MDAALPRDEHHNQVAQRFKRIGVLVGSLGVAFLTTLLLTLVWEMRIDGKDYRRLYPTPLVDVILVGIAVVGCALVVIEIFRVIRVPLAVYPSILSLYLGALISVTYLFSYDFVISRNHPLEQKNSEQDAADQLPAR